MNELLGIGSADSLIEPRGVEPRGAAAPWFGRPWEHRHAAVAALGSFILCGIYWIGARLWAIEVVPGWIEFAGTATSLWSVWITQRRNVLALPVGIVSVVLMGWFFHKIGLRGQMLLHFGYYLPIQFWAWREWTRGGDGQTELNVTWLKGRTLLAVIVAMCALTLLIGGVLDAAWEDAVYVYWDASIVASSVVAMALMSRKKVESWWLWIFPVNISAIGLYVSTGAYMFGALYVLFLVMACVGQRRWAQAAAHRMA